MVGDRGLPSKRQTKRCAGRLVEAAEERLVVIAPRSSRYAPAKCMATEALHERLVEVGDELDEARAERARVAAKLDALRAKIEDRQRSLAALAKLDLPPRSIVFQLGSAGPLFNMGTQLVRDGQPILACLAVLMLLVPALGAALSFRRERRLLAAIEAPRPERTRVAEDLVTEDEAPASDSAARKGRR
jgi:hypothetical protein